MTFVQVRQAVIGVPDVGPASTRVQQELGLAPGFADPLLAEIGMDDESLVLGDERSFLELVAPLRPDVSLARWLAKGGGPGGYALSVQVGDAAPFLARMAKLGLDVAADVEAYGYRLLQLRPGQLGLLLELDEVPDPEAWFWDSVDKQYPTDPQVDHFTSLELMSPDPDGQAATWGALFDVPVSPDRTIELGRLTCSFVEGPRSMLSGIGLARAAGSKLAPGSTLLLHGVRLDLT